MTYQLLFLFGAGFFGGVLNAVAGGGSFITFPALLFVGVPPISANATNTFASCAGYLSGAYALRKDLAAWRDQLPQIIGISLVGGGLGALLLLQTPESVFRQAIPWLLLFATLLFVFGGRLNRILRDFAARHRHASLLGGLLQLLLLMGVSVYGGFFNAGLGIIILSYLVLAGYTDINTMNGVKLLISSVISLVAILLFIYDGVIAWFAGVVVMLGTLAGGYVAAHMSRKLPQRYVKSFIVFAGSGITLYFFYETYF
ncbi:MAG: sulfite exporter TauE/SafE family protein [Candidatus Thiodiazotropha sp.]